jgi:hypothetical protein
MEVRQTAVGQAMTRARGHELAAGGRTGLTLAARSCSLLKVAPQVLQRHPVIGVRAAFATCIREGLKDKASSPPHCKHKCLGKRPLFLGLRVNGVPPLAKAAGWGVQLQFTGLVHSRLAGLWGL